MVFILGEWLDDGIDTWLFVSMRLMSEGIDEKGLKFILYLYAEWGVKVRRTRIDRNLKISRKTIEETEIFISQSLDDMITGRKDDSSKNTYSKLLGRDSEFSSPVIAMNSSNSEKISSSRGVPSIEEVNIKDHSFNSNSKIELFLFNSNNCISSVKKGSSQDERKFAIFFNFENNEISRNGLRVLRDTFAYKEYGIRLMLAPRSAKALHEKVLKLHGIRKLPESSSFGGTLFWIIVELSSLKKAAEICSNLC
uniref:Uncharacterized protein n=1 Tax=Tanacetum cinerariifolium TaxID=118510 RepID=A0A6L2NUP1_TANCI|nr:hypothetical protein [Tanacetum cinerariifolium]